MTYKVLVTGGAGFIGYHLAHRLASDGHNVIIADNFARGVEDRHLAKLTDSKNVRSVNIDLLDADELAKIGRDINVIFHLAAVVGVSHVSKSPYGVLEKNVALTLNLLEFARRQKSFSRFMYASTSEVVAGTLAAYGIDIPTPESTPFTLPNAADARATYALSKIYGEALCYHSEVPFTIFRPHNIYGPRMGMSHVVPEMLRKCYLPDNNSNVDVYSPEHKRTFCYIDDAVEILARLAIAESADQQCVNLGNQSGETTIWDLARTIHEIVGSTVTLERAEVTAGSPARRCPDVSLATELTGHSAEIDIRSGVSRTFDWYRKNVFDSNDNSAI